jgi:hypothetical protein
MKTLLSLQPRWHVAVLPAVAAPVCFAVSFTTDRPGTTDLSLLSRYAGSALYNADQACVGKAKRSCMRMRQPLLPARRQQPGQALAFSLVFTAATALVCLMLYNSSMLATTKTQLQNAADAAAYSAGVMLARDHNFSAYTNRAMVANQVAVAQLVSLKSYLDDAAATHDRMQGPAHMAQSSLVPAFKPLWSVALNAPVDSVNNAYGNMAPAAVKGLDDLIAAFQTGQEAYHQLTAVNVLLVANEVARRNDPKAAITRGVFAGTTLLQVNAWRDDYTRRYRANDAAAPAGRFADTVVDAASTDKFIRDRHSTLAALWASMPTEAACPAMLPIWTDYHFNHRGGTLLSADKKRWLALDATQGDGFVTCLIEDPVLPLPFYYPLLADGPGGAAGAAAGAGSGYDATGGYANNPAEARAYGKALTDADTSTPAGIRYVKGPGATMDSGGGLQDYYRDVGDLAGAPANQSAALNGGSAPVTIEVEHKDADIRTASRVLGEAAANVRLPTAMKGATMRVLASAHAYFFRPAREGGMFTKTGWQRADGKTEMANLFNPYWQAQLVDRTEDKRLLSIGSQ